ncbi:MAG TPA: TonB-dependent receptor [Gammaproteobacteria bacterium]
MAQAHLASGSMESSLGPAPRGVGRSAALGRVPLAVALALGALGPAAAAWGQQRPQQRPIEEITVIGQPIGDLRLDEPNGAGGRLGLTPLETPASVDLITQEEIAAKGDYAALDAVTRAAGVSASANPGNGGTSVSVRGFNGHNTTINTYDGTRLYVAAGTVTFPADTSTLERVEVLRGAGSVVNGVGALGATINYVPKAPVFGPSDFDAQLTTGSFGLKRLSLGGGAQLGERWAYRLDGAYHDEDGYVDRADETRKVIAGSLLFRPSGDLSVKLSLDYADVEPANYFGTPLIDGRASDDHRKNNYNFGNGFVEYEDLWARVRTDWTIAPGIRFRNDTYYLDAFREWQNLEEYAYDPVTDLIDRASYLGIIHDQQQVGTRSDVLFEHDFGEMANRLSVGAEINSIDLDYHDNFNTGGFDFADSVPVFGFDPGRLPPDVPTILDYTTDSRQYALFVDDVLEVSERLSLVLGARYDNFEFDRFNHPLFTGRPASAFDAGFSETTWRAGLVYRPSPALSFYAQTSTAADPVTSPISISLGSSGFDLSTGRQYEVGVKQQVMSGRGEYTVAYFDIEKKGMITRLPGSTVDEQIGKQSSDGFELTFRYNPTDNLSFDFNAVSLDARFDEFFSGGVSLAGNAPSNVPERTANAWVSWSPAERFQLGIGARYVAERFGDVTNTQTLPSYTVLDAYANWSVNDNLTVVLRGRNLTDEEDYVLSQYTTDQWVFGDPRAFELSFRYAR